METEEKWVWMTNANLKLDLAGILNECKTPSS